MPAVCLLTLLAAYLLGSIPTGYLVGRARGVDLRQSGSGNIGATNAFRVLGKPAGSFVLVVDAVKGILAATLVPHLAMRSLGPPGALLPVWLQVVGGLAAVLGHNYPCWLRFQGGKGVATSAGVVLGLVPLALLSVLGVFLVGLVLTRIVSLSSLIGAALLPLAIWFWHREPVLVGFGAALAALVFVRHRANIGRLLAGTEPRLGQSSAGSPGSPTTP